ncbi:MAG: VTC domain-containing protein [Planctomycetes bacterium]|nr:VTC domain-containing protein [Planctomycetota bacterium]
MSTNPTDGISAKRNRYERKFAVRTHASRADVEALVALHPACFSEIYQPRHVNNIYCDSLTTAGFMANLSGERDRVKARVRWYGEQFGQVSRPALELKIKRGFLGRKLVYPMSGFCCDVGFDWSQLLAAIQTSPIPEDIKIGMACLKPHLLNRYHRKYFLSADRLFRITIDSDLAYTEIAAQRNSFAHRRLDHGTVIIELKYDQSHDDVAERISGYFPFRLSRFSKYVEGILALQ